MHWREHGQLTTVSERLPHSKLDLGPVGLSKRAVSPRCGFLVCVIFAKGIFLQKAPSVQLMGLEVYE